VSEVSEPAAVATESEVPAQDVAAEVSSVTEEVVAVAEATETPIAEAVVEEAPVAETQAE